MKNILQFILALTMSVQALAAAPATPGYYIPIEIDKRTENSNTLNFTFPGRPKGGFVKGQVYFLYDGDRYFSAVNSGTDSKGQTLWSYVEEMPTPTQGDRDYVTVRPGKSATAIETPEQSTNITAPQQNPSPGYFGSAAHEAGMGAAIQGGIAQGIYRGLIYTPEYAEKMAALNGQIARDNAEIAASYGQVTKSMAAMSEKVTQAINQLRISQQENPFDPSHWNQDIKYTSSDDELLTRLKELESLLSSLRTTEPSQQAARFWGYKMIEQSDASSAEGDTDSSKAFYKYAQAFADLAVGLDPITGPIRDVYEACTGLNLITGEPLDDVSRGLAILGIVTFGYGSKIGKGLRVFRKIQKTEKTIEIIKDVEKIGVHIETKLGPSQNRALYHKYVAELRRGMERPVVQDPKMKDFLEKRFWKDTVDPTGNGSTMAAIRHERLTGQPVKGRNHIKKGTMDLTALKKWQKNNPDASAADRRAVENIVEDLVDALEGPL